MRDLPRILLVDDEKFMLTALRRTLASEMEVHVALSGAEAITLLHQTSGFAVILSDLAMPGMDGVKFLQHARELLPRAVQIMLTGALDSESGFRTAEQHGIFRYLEKPCRSAQLVDAIRAALAHYEATCTSRST